MKLLLFKINNELKYLLVLLFFSIALIFFLPKSNKGYGIILFFLATTPIYYYYAFLKLINISKYLKNRHPHFYKKNQSIRRYKSLKLVLVPLFGFVKEIELLNDDDILKEAYDLKKKSNYSFYSFIISLIMMILSVLIP